MPNFKALRQGAATTFLLFAFTDTHASTSIPTLNFTEVVNQFEDSEEIVKEEGKESNSPAQIESDDGREESEDDESEDDKKYSQKTLFENSYIKLSTASYDKLKGWGDDNYLEIMQALKRSCSAITAPKNKQAAKFLKTQHVTYSSVEQWKTSCANFLEFASGINPEKSKYNKKLRAFIEENYIPVAVEYDPKGNGNFSDKGLFTGYYEITLTGSRKRGGKNIYPIYGVPKDFKRGEQYMSRKAIMSGALEGKGLEIAWVSDRIELFSLHVQGSGVIELDEGGIMKVGYADKNNRPYSSYYKYFSDRPGLLKKANKEGGLVKYMRNHPGIIDDALSINESFIFFREATADAAPLGCQGVGLTGQRSMAVDTNFIPLGSMVWLETNITTPSGRADYNRLFVAQDTGSAIKGAIRGDIFFGKGKEARFLAEKAKDQGKYYLLLPNEVVTAMD